MNRFISYERSMELLDSLDIKQLPTQKLFISDALGKILAKDIVADHSSPEYLTSAMDGYAIKAGDQEKKCLKIIDYNPAGSITNSVVSRGECIKTFTGSLMPEGSDTLIPIENVTVENDTIIINDPVELGFATRQPGENYSKGETLIKKGSKIGFAEIGVMASLNISQALCFIPPNVAIASTGSEILDLGETQENESQIRSSNHLTLEAIAKQNGANVFQMGVVRDDKESITKLLKNALSKADIVVTTGGVSVGDYDYVKDVIKDELGAEVLFQGVKIKPGQHILFARKDDKFIIGLPGFAYSSTVTFILYALPLIYRLKGSREKIVTAKGRLSVDFPKRVKKTVFTACNANYIDGEYKIDFEGKKSGTSAILTNMLENPALLMQDEDNQGYSKGDLVDIVLL